jgi:hypothetical protein
LEFSRLLAMYCRESNQIVRFNFGHFSRHINREKYKFWITRQFLPRQTGGQKFLGKKIKVSANAITFE